MDNDWNREGSKFHHDLVFHASKVHPENQSKNVESHNMILNRQTKRKRIKHTLSGILSCALLSLTLLVVKPLK